ncbi:hypothetical protein BASA81_008955 [Batrachochytrium salamandrivorans]|nr:hypothetical protein BASA81_008955 [Batrachochytrium salamandrivorans]
MVQLFKPDFQPFGNRYLMNPITFDLLLTARINVDPYAKAWQRPRPGKRRAKKQSLHQCFFPLNSMESAKRPWPGLFPPYGSLNDGRCYSACEVFSGSIQGHDAGTILEKDNRLVVVVLLS